jgi:hypothetical protein
MKKQSGIYKAFIAASMVAIALISPTNTANAAIHEGFTPAEQLRPVAVGKIRHERREDRIEDRRDHKKDRHETRRDAKQDRYEKHRDYR